MTTAEPQYARLRCIICGDRLPRAFPDKADLPYGGTVFTTHGHYGSTVFDPAAGSETLEITICDHHMRAKAREGLILHNTVVRYEEPVYETRPWEGPQPSPQQAPGGSEGEGNVP